MSAQLTLPVSRFDGAAFDNFFAPKCADTLSAVRDVTTSNKPQTAIYLSGPAGSGKTHLCWAACRAVSEQGLVPSYIPLGRPGVAFSFLETVSGSQLVCLDDVHVVASDKDWNQRLFSLLEHQFLRGNLKLIVTGQQPVAELDFDLADLQSRVSLLPGFRIQPLTDSEKAFALRSRAERRGMEVDVEVIDYILSRFSRDTHALFGFLDKLDLDSISRQRRITIPFVRSVLEQQA